MLARRSELIRAVDLFCGAGGLTRGLLDSGVQVVAGIDVNADCEYAYTYNNKGVIFLHESVSSIGVADLSRLFGSAQIKLLCGCAPCQTFSTMNRADLNSRKKDGRWSLLGEVGRLVEESVPDLVTMENVPGLIKTDVFSDFIRTLKSTGYYLDYKILDCSEYGMPQKRLRLVLVASRLGKITIPAPTQLGCVPMTVRDAIGGLVEIGAGETSPKDSLHTASKLSQANLNRIKASVPGGTWRDWDAGLVLRCHREKSGDGYGAVYGRMEWDKPSPTITTQFYNYGSGRFGHPSQDRAISLREGALLQGFPPSYRFDNPEKPLGKRKIGMLIGNAVPVGLGRIVGKVFCDHVSSLV